MIAGFIMVMKLMPDERIAPISLSSDICPKLIQAVTNTAIGTAKAVIHPRFKKRYSKIVGRSKPLPKNLSIALRRN